MKKISKKKRKKILNRVMTVLVTLGLVIILASTVVDRIAASNVEYGRVVTLDALYDEPSVVGEYTRLSYEEMAEINGIEIEEETTEEVIDASDYPEFDITSSETTISSDIAASAVDIAERARQRKSQYQLNEYYDTSANTEIDLSNLASQAGATATSQTITTGQYSNSNVGSPVYTTTTGTYIGQFVLTAYCPCAICCGKTNGITASGKLATSNHTIATDKRFSFGTQLIINGQVYTVEDRGGAIQGNRIDVFFNTHQEALNFGRKTADVYLYTGQ